MILNGKKTRYFTVNLFVDFILTNIDPTLSSRIQVTDVGKFFIINGATESEERVNLSMITEQFNELFKDLIHEPITNTLDLIDYKKNIDHNKLLIIDLHDSSNCLYHKKQLISYSNDPHKNYMFNGYHIYEYDDNDLPSVSSILPFGSSANYRGLLNLAKQIYYNLTTDCLVSSLHMTLDLRDEEPIVKIFNRYTDEYDKRLESTVLDYFDFILDLDHMVKETMESNIMMELLNPDLDFVKEKPRLPDFYIL